MSETFAKLPWDLDVSIPKVYWYIRFDVMQSIRGQIEAENRKKQELEAMKRGYG